MNTVTKPPNAVRRPAKAAEPFCLELRIAYPSQKLLPRPLLRLVEGLQVQTCLFGVRPYSRRQSNRFLRQHLAYQKILSLLVSDSGMAESASRPNVLELYADLYVYQINKGPASLQALVLSGAGTRS